MSKEEDKIRDKILKAFGVISERDLNFLKECVESGIPLSIVRGIFEIGHTVGFNEGISRVKALISETQNELNE